MSDRWFPGTDRSRPAPVDGGSILGGKPKCLWHDTETSGLPSYSTGFFPNMTISPVTGHTWQHIPADRACRALRNESGGVQTNRWNVFQIEIIGWVNKIPFHPVMADIAQWLHEVRGTPLSETVDWLPYDASYGNSRVRLSGARWSTYSGHLGHMHAPENSHGDPGWPFPIDKIIKGQEADDMYDADAEKRLKDYILDTLRQGLAGDKDTPVRQWAGQLDRVHDALLAGHAREDVPIDNLYTTAIVTAAKVATLEAKLDLILAALPDPAP